MCLKSKSKSEVYVKDLRAVMLFNGKRLKYPKNYDKIVESGTIIINGTDSEGNTILKLLYGIKNKNGMRPAWTLTHIADDVCHSKAYYSMYKLVFEPELLDTSYFEPFGFSRLDLKKYVPVIDIKETGDPNNPYQLVNTLYLAKKGSVSAESGEVDSENRKKKGLNGKQLYKSTYGKQNPRFFVIRDELKKLELDKTILCFPLCLVAYTVIFIRKMLTFLPMKFGECLLHQKNAVAKIFGHIFFSPFVPLKFIVDLLAIFVKSPILLFVAYEKKYGDSYFVLWKYELIECFYELKSDCSVMKNGTRPITVSDYDEYTLIGTWNELNIRKQFIESSDIP